MILPVLADNDKELLMPPTGAPLFGACQGAEIAIPVSGEHQLCSERSNFLRVCVAGVMMLEKNVVCSLHYHHVLILTWF
jgi:hypothetical protein